MLWYPILNKTRSPIGSFTFVRFLFPFTLFKQLYLNTSLSALCVLWAWLQFPTSWPGCMQGVYFLVPTLMKDCGAVITTI